MALSKQERRQRIRYRIRRIVSGSAERPRMSVFRSNKEIYVQLIDDVNGVTLAAASSREKDFAATGTKTDKAKNVIPPTSPSGKKRSRNTSCAGLLHGATVSPDGTPNVPPWDASIWASTSIFTEEEWT